LGIWRYILTYVGERFGDRHLSDWLPQILRLQPTPLSMLRLWPSSGAARALCRTFRRPLQIRQHKVYSSAVAPSLNAASADRVPLRKQLKQEAKNLKAHKKHCKESEEASRQQWELTVGVEIHAQLNAGAKLFSRMTFNCLRDCRMLLILT
jgi:hypothetical protein